MSPFKCKVLASLSETFLMNQYISFMSVIEKRMEAVELEKEIDYEIS